MLTGRSRASPVLLQLKWREAQEEVLGLRAKLNDMQAAAVQSAALGRQLADCERAKAGLETEVSQLLRDRSSLQDACAALEAQARQAEGKAETMRDLRQQVEQQAVRFPQCSPALSSCRPASAPPRRRAYARFVSWRAAHICKASACDSARVTAPGVCVRQRKSDSARRAASPRVPVPRVPVPVFRCRAHVASG